MIRRHPLLVLVAAGVAIRLVFAFAFFGDEDVRVWRQVEDAVRADPLGVYELNRPDASSGIGLVWPYPPLLLTAIWVPSLLAGATGLPFHGTVHLLPILADVGIAVAIHAYLGSRGAAERVRLAGAALVMLGPAFIAVSGYHGQFDQLAILPAVLALMLWERRPPGSRATDSGVLLGVGAAMKTVPGLVALPLLASARSVGEGARLIGITAAVVLATTLPFLIADPEGVLALRDYKGWPGLGGLSLVTNPGHGRAWLHQGIDFRTATPLAEFLVENAGAMTAITIVAVTLFLFRYRPAPIDGAVLLWLALYTFSPNFFMHYLVWGLPFFVMAGYLRETAILQLALTPAIAIYYLSPFQDPDLAVAIYVPSMICLWALWTTALVTLATRTMTRHPGRGREVQPPLVDLETALARPALLRSRT